MSLTFSFCILFFARQHFWPIFREHNVT
uniref:Uncharacterized protein n=1 Tax=Anguilla anguilla TaxID=7936 RepID=A0A0E9R4G4_ANGAN